MQIDERINLELEGIKARIEARGYLQRRMSREKCPESALEFMDYLEEEVSNN